MATRIQPVAAAPAPAPEWSIDAARALYNVDGWGVGYFDINERGHVIVRPDPDRGHLTLDLKELSRDLEEQGIQ
ncbi:MAG: arginine decarboxylase, partial [Gemmatimonas sp.]